MRILWLKAEKLLPVHNGGNIRSYHLARSLSARHDLTFFSYYAGEPDRAYEQQLESALPGAASLATGKPSLSGLRRILDYAAHLPARPPYAVSRFASSAVRARLHSWFQQRRFEVVVCDFLDAAVNLPRQISIPVVLFQHNVESEIWRRHAETEANPITRLLYGIEFRKMLRYERRTVNRFDHVIAVSEHDRRLMSEWVDPSRITVVPTGVDLHQFQPSAVTARQPVVVFVGAMDWEPNVDAVEYFCAEIWPAITQRIPAARFRIVGRNPGPRVQKLASSSVEVTGSVPSVLPHLHEAAVVVVPLRVGGGTRLKIYEAMAAGKAVVSTSVGAEGLDVNHGHDILLADDSGAFAAAVEGLLQNGELCRSYGHNAAETSKKYDWHTIGENFGRLVEMVAGGATRVGHARSSTAETPVAVLADSEMKGH